MDQLLKVGLRNHLEGWLSMIGLIAMLIAAYFSNGPFHSDEHFQILEFLHYKFGKTPLEDLPWEFNEQMRPGLQVALGYWIIKFFVGIGLVNPFDQVMGLRFISGGCCWLLLHAFYRICKNQYPEGAHQRLFKGMMHLLWFIPLLGVRFSSENWAAMAFFTGIYVLNPVIWNPKTNLSWRGLAGGFLMGLSFYFRFQMGFAILGYSLWMLIIQRVGIHKLSQWFVGLLLAFAASVWSDHWFYQEWVCTPCNYFTANILDHKAAGFGVSPWWYYVKLFLWKGIPPISLILLLWFLLGCCLQTKHAMTWIIVPFIIGHSMVGHKELRFMFPMLLPFLILAMHGAVWFFQHYSLESRWTWLKKSLISINVILLLVVLFTPAKPVVNMYRFLFEKSKQQRQTVLSIDKGVYDYFNLKIHFYKSENIESKVFKDQTSLKEYLNRTRPLQFLFITERALKQDDFEGCVVKRLYCNLPDWVSLLNFNHWMERTKIWSVYEVQCNDFSPSSLHVPGNIQ